MRLAALGDSNNHAYHDDVYFRPGGADRGGAWHAYSWQWTELLARWRGNQIDMGPWRYWGQHGWRLALAHLVGLDLRTPRKLDFAYNFAVGAAGCDGLLHGPMQQAVRLQRLIARNPKRWADGVVVVRIGEMDLSSEEWLAAAANDPNDALVQHTLTRCQQALTHTVARLHSVQPNLRLVLVGVMNEADDPRHHDNWQGTGQYANIQRALDGYDGHLRLLAQADPARRLFIDNRAWFANHWGGRDTQGQPAYHPQTLGQLEVTPTAGDAPHNLLLADQHFGTAANALWAKHLLDAMLTHWPDLHLTPLGAAELEPLWAELRNARPTPLTR